MKRRVISTTTCTTAVVLLLLCSTALSDQRHEKNLVEAGLDAGGGEDGAYGSIKRAFHMTSEWKADQPCAGNFTVWVGVECDIVNQEVRTIDLSGRDIAGYIPPEIGALKGLEILNLSNNKFSGEIPDSLARLRKLISVDLDNNDFCGSKPESLDSTDDRFSFTGNPRLCNVGTPSCTCQASPPRLEPTPVEKQSLGIGLIVGAIVGGFVVLAVLGGCFVCFYLRSRRKTAQSLPLASESANGSPPQEPTAKHAASHRSSASDEFRNTINSPFPPVVERVGSPTTLSQAAGFISKANIVAATNNFSKRIGEGGYGPVYWGKLANGKEVAVKVNKVSSQGTEEFINEVGLLTRVHHRNLVTLLGFCEDGDERMLVYEFQKNGTLSDLLWGKGAENNPLDWTVRLDLALNAARGLEYLHNGCSPRIIHRDVKSNNILVDDKFVAKVADFGISKATPDGGSTNGSYSTLVRGTVGYMDPEYLMNQRLSQKSDVYSFGIVLMETMAGCRPHGTLADGSVFNIVNMVRDALSTGDILALADPALKEQFSPESMWRVADIAFSSVDRQGSRRPDMAMVVRALTEAIEIESAHDPRVPPAGASWSRASTFHMHTR